MGSEDDVAYKRSVRNMSFVLAAIVITVFAAIIIPPYINPIHNNFQASVSLETGQSATLFLLVNSTSIAPEGHVNVTIWLKSTYPSINNVTAANQWSLPPGYMWTRSCTAGFPIGVGLMRGHYDQSNYSQGQLLRPNLPWTACPISTTSPRWFAFEPGTPNAIVNLGGTLEHWTISTGVIAGPGSFAGSGAGGFSPGVYTVLAADEWGDVLTTNFVVVG